MGEVEQGLAAAVRADLDGWDAWLVYGDWLTEQGDVRGELIALEHRLAVEALSDKELRAVRRRGGVSARSCRPTAAWLAGWAPPPGARLKWRHGFVVGVRTKWRDGTLAVLERLAAHPVGRLFIKLDLRESGIGDESVRALTSSEALGSLTALNLAHNSIGADGARVGVVRFARRAQPLWQPHRPRGRAGARRL
jgi:uncharacterized protein (TIGR02996 family)